MHCCVFGVITDGAVDVVQMLLFANGANTPIALGWVNESTLVLLHCCNLSV